MERICSQCHAVIAAESQQDWCPACGGAIVSRSTLSGESQTGAAASMIDHRGIVLPRRHAVGGIISPQ